MLIAENVVKFTYPYVLLCLPLGDKVSETWCVGVRKESNHDEVSRSD